MKKIQLHTFHGQPLANSCIYFFKVKEKEIASSDY